MIPQVVSTSKAKQSEEFWIVTASFVSKVVNKVEGMDVGELTPTLRWLSERKYCYLLQHFKIFSKFRINKTFVTWRLNVKRMKPERSK
ncbi:uncharacterized protein LOC121166831 isoform X4 [Ochotona curzoniae]|uniref:uncharacterized protein LOC121166831 isoform X4 n=1 Tax=Ochotona curzoniae TaxID=130825 RepID=UPI001B351BB5|nr:uncharacterized protein LOC121166831 isoform X4 [Ochotona curzoniae]